MVQVYERVEVAAADGTTEETFRLLPPLEVQQMQTGNGLLKLP